MNKNYIKYLSGIINEEQFHFAESVDLGNFDEKEIMGKLLKYAKQLVNIFNWHEDEMEQIVSSSLASNEFDREAGLGYSGHLQNYLMDLAAALNGGLAALHMGAGKTAGMYDGEKMLPIMLDRLGLLGLDNPKTSKVTQAIKKCAEIAAKDTHKDLKNNSPYVVAFRDSIEKLNHAIVNRQTMMRA